ncbi:hypothetical protein ACFLTB_07680, partial [Chloroflexota bacterium]
FARHLTTLLLFPILAEIAQSGFKHGTISYILAESSLTADGLGGPGRLYFPVVYTIGKSMQVLTPDAQTELNRTIDRIRRKYGFTAIQTGQTLLLKDLYPETKKGYNLHTPGLSR